MGKLILKYRDNILPYPELHRSFLEPTVVVKRNTNFVMDGMVNLKKIHGNISLEADEDAVPTRTKEKIERSSDGDIVVSESKKVNPGLIIGGYKSAI